MSKGHAVPKPRRAKELKKRRDLLRTFFEMSLAQSTNCRTRSPGQTIGPSTRMHGSIVRGPMKMWTMRPYGVCNEGAEKFAASVPAWVWGVG